MVDESSNRELIERLGSEDGDTRDGALTEAIERGRAVTPDLLAALRGPDERRRIAAADALSVIADPASADALAAALNDGNDRVRARAATGLANMGDPRALDALVRTLNDFTDLLNARLSLSAYTLARLGPPALPAVLPLLKDSDARTRTKAIWIIRKIASRLVEAEDNGQRLWESLGSYDPNAPAAERDRAADQWSAWIAEHVANGQARHD
jgi:HEAT repeat protein